MPRYVRGIQGLSFPAPYLRAPTWVPTDIGAALVGYYDAENNATITAVSGAASVIADVVAAGVSFAQGTAASRPAIITSAITGRQVLSADGVDDNMTITPAPAAYPLTGTFSWIFIGVNSAVDSTGRYCVSVGNVSPTSIRFATRTASNVLQIVTGATNLNGPIIAGVGNPGWNGAHLVQGNFVNAGSVAGVDDVYGVIAALTLPNNNTRMRLFATPTTAPAGFFRGEMSAFMIINGAISREIQNNINIFAGRRLGL